MLFFENILLQAWKYSNVNKLKAFGCLYFIKPTVSRESNITQHASNQSNDNEEFGAWLCMTSLWACVTGALWVDFTQLDSEYNFNQLVVTTWLSTGL